MGHQKVVCFHSNERKKNSTIESFGSYQLPTQPTETKTHESTQENQQFNSIILHQIPKAEIQYTSTTL